MNFAFKRGINNANVRLLLQQSTELLEVGDFQHFDPGATEMKPLVLVCSRDAGFYLLISHILKVDGFDCLPAGNLDEVAQILSQHPVAVILLDCNDRVLDTAGHIDRIRQTSNDRSIEIVALLPTGNEALYLELLKAGIKQIFVSPYAPERLLETLRLLAGTGEPSRLAGDFAETTFTMGKLELFPQKHRVQYEGAEVELAPIQFRLLAVMMVEPGRIFSREELIAAAWPHNIHVEPRTVDVHIGRLRNTLNKVAGHDLIRTVRSAGYGLDARSASSEV